MENIVQLVEALIFASDIPVPSRKLKEIMELESEKEVRAAVKTINQNYQKIESPLHVIEVAGGYQIVTQSEYAAWIKKLYRSRSAGHLTQRALETMAIIAYKQPITKPEMEAIRGVNVDAVLRTLIERNLITVTGRLKAPGTPLLYGTTKYFLEYFGLKHIKDLPKLREIDELLKGDDKFLESLDQVALQEIYPDALGMSTMLETDKDGQGKDEDMPDVQNEAGSIKEGEQDAPE